MNKDIILVLSHLCNSILTSSLFSQGNDPTHTVLLIKVIFNLTWKWSPLRETSQHIFSEGKQLKETSECLTVSILNDNLGFRMNCRIIKGDLGYCLFDFRLSSAINLQHFLKSSFAQDLHSFFLIYLASPCKTKYAIPISRLLGIQLQNSS